MTTINGICRKIALRSDGLHGVVYRDNLSEHYLMTWRTENDVKEVKMPWPPGAVSDADFGFLDLNRIAVTGMDGFVQPPHAIEVSLTNQTQVLDWIYGTPESRFGEGCQLSNGGFVRVNYVDTSPANMILLEVTYRSPSAPPLPLNDPGNWWSGRFEFPSNTGSPLPFIFTVIEGPDKLIWAFFSRDSAGQIGLARFSVSGNQLKLVDENAGWIDRNQGSVTPQGEIPRLTSTLDRDNKRILLIYQSWDWLPTNCVNTGGVSQTVITAVHPDKTFTEVATIPFWAFHMTFPLSVAWSRPDGVYFIVSFTDLSTCVSGWKSGLIDKSRVIHYNQDIIGGKIVSYSDDGWFIFEHTDRTCSLERMKFAPKLSISQSGANAVISWDVASKTDQLQQSSDLKTWTDLAGATISPVTVLMSGVKMFRLRK